MISWGLTASRIAIAWFIISWSTPRRPAVSTMTTLMPALTGEFDAGARNLDGVTHAVTRLGGPHLDAGALADDLELLDGVGALEVGGHEEDGLAFLAQPLAELSGQGGLTGTLKAGEHKDGGTGLRESQFAGGTPRISTSSSWTMETTCWPGLRALERAAP